MTELAVVRWPFRRLGATLLRFRTAGWLLTLTGIIILVAIALTFFGFGQLQGELTAPLLGYFLLISFFIGVWTGYARLTGYRPAEARFWSRSVWFDAQQVKGWGFMVLVSVLTLLGFCFGVGSRHSVPWPQESLLAVALLILLTSQLALGSALAVGIKTLSRNIFVRTLLIILLVDGAVIGARALLPLWTVVANGWQNAPINSIFLTILLAIGTLGTALAITELVLPLARIELHPPRRYWALPLPSRTMGNFGPGTAAYTAEIIYFLRSARLQRRLIAAIAVLVLGVVCLNLFSPSYSANAQILFEGLLVVVLGFIADSVGFTAGLAGERFATEHAHLPQPKHPVIWAYLAAAVSVMIVISAILLELFAVSAVNWSVVALLGWAGLLVTGVTFAFGRTAHQLAIKATDPSTKTAVMAANAVLIIILAGIIVTFAGLVSAGQTALVLLAWAAAFWGLAVRLRRA